MKISIFIYIKQFYVLIINHLIQYHNTLHFFNSLSFTYMIKHVNESLILQNNAD